MVPLDNLIQAKYRLDECTDSLHQIWNDKKYKYFVSNLIDPIMSRLDFYNAELNSVIIDSNCISDTLSELEDKYQ